MTVERLVGTPFAIVPEWVLYAEISDRAVRLYGVLQRHVSRREGVAYPGQETLGRLLGCSVDSIQRALKELTELGAIETLGGHGAARTTNDYVVISDDPQHRTAAVLASQSRRAAVSNTAPVRHKREEVDPEVLSSTKTVRGRTPEQATLEGMDKSARRERISRLDPIWELFAAEFGSPTNENIRGRRARAIRFVKDSLATIPQPRDDLQEIQQRIDVARRVWGRRGIVFSDMTVATRWDLLTQMLAADARPDRKLGAEEVFQQALDEGLATTLGRDAA